jgi:membrane associated rhomboid family serine protease
MDRNARTATSVITIVTALAWLLAAVSGMSDRISVLGGFIPARFSGYVSVPGGVPTILTPLTATLIHSGPVHLGFNLLIFFWCGMQVERVLGRAGLIVLYVVGAFASALLQWASAPAAAVPMVGASGAISAVIGAYALSFGRPKAFIGHARLNRMINVVWLMVAWIVLQLMMGWYAGGQGYLLATPAHIGGFAAGLLLQRPLLLWHYRKA